SVVPLPARPQWGGDIVLRVVLGPQADRFTDEGVAAFLGSAYEVLPQSDRMGARLNGPRIAHARGHDIISDGIALGAVQVPGDGQPIVLLVDRQSTGGYTKIATVCSFDLARVGQAKPRPRRTSASRRRARDRVEIVAAQAPAWQARAFTGSGPIHVPRPRLGTPPHGDTPRPVAVPLQPPHDSDAGATRRGEQPCPRGRA